MSQTTASATIFAAAGVIRVSGMLDFLRGMGGG
jgi:hypothetical protein